ncbi:hypothetical protein D3C83_86750 [compost metagenome]
MFYSGNYINWLDNGSTITQSRLQIVQHLLGDADAKRLRRCQRGHGNQPTRAVGHPFGAPAVVLV